MYLDSDSIAALLDSASSFEAEDGHVLFVCFHENLALGVPSFIELMNARGILIVGGIFPGLISNGSLKETGVLVQSLPLAEAPVLIENISTDFELPESLGKNTNTSDLHDFTAFVFVDGLSAGISRLTSLLQDRLGDKVNYIGGGAGSASLVQKPCLFTNEGFVADAALVFVSSLSSCLGVRHGWERIAGPFIATKTIGNTILELNWENAFDVYREHVEKASESEFDLDSFSSQAKSFPFGLYREGQEDIIRDPIKMNEDGHLICVGEVDENSILYLMHGDEETLLRSAELATRDCCRQIQQDKGFKLGFIAECISRAQFLEEAFEKELEIITSSFKSYDELKTVGILTLGEISTYGRGYLEFLNKTLVTSILYEREEARNKSDRRDLSALRDISQHRHVS